MTDRLNGGDPSGFVPLKPGDPGYPTPAQWARLKGYPAGDIQQLTDEEVAALVRGGYVAEEDAT